MPCIPCCPWNLLSYGTGANAGKPDADQPKLWNDGNSPRVHFQELNSPSSQEGSTSLNLNDSFAQSPTCCDSMGIRKRLQRRYTDTGAFGSGVVIDDVMAEFWPALRRFIEDYVLLGIVEPALKKSVWSHMKFERCSLGNSPPKARGLKSHRFDDPEERSVEWACDLDFSGDQVDIELLVEKGLRVSIEDIQIRGTFCIQFSNFLSELPLLSGVNAYFMNPPDVKIRFGKDSLLGVMKHIEGMLVSVEGIIAKQLAAALVVPHKLTVHLSPLMTYYELHYPPPSGILDIQLKSVVNIPTTETVFGILQPQFRVDLRLGGEEWNSPWAKLDKEGSAVWNQSCSFAVDYQYGQSLIVELRCADGISLGSGKIIGHTRLSVANIVSASVAAKTTWRLDMDENTFGCAAEGLFAKSVAAFAFGAAGTASDSEDESDASLKLSGVFRPLFSGSSLAEARNLQPLSESTQGMLVIILESCVDLGVASEGAYIECGVSVGSNTAETWRVVGKRMVPEDCGTEAGGKLKFLLERAARDNRDTPSEIAFLAGVDEEKVEAIKRGSVRAELGYQLRVRVLDPLKDDVTFELKRGKRNPKTVARFKVSIRDILNQPGWLLPMKERTFNEILEPAKEQAISDGSGAQCLPKFVASVHFLGVQRAANGAESGSFISHAGRVHRDRFTERRHALGMAPQHTDAVYRRHLSILGPVEDGSEAEDGGAEQKSNKRDVHKVLRLSEDESKEAKQKFMPPGHVRVHDVISEESVRSSPWCIQPCM